MVRNAEETARSAEASTSNGVGMCLQWSRERATIPALHPDAATAWKHAVHRHKKDRNPPRGAMVYWTGGSKGYGHIAVSLGNGKIRSSDAGGSGKPATVALTWPEQRWGMPYAGWADNVNDRVIPGVGGGGEDDDMPLNETDLTKIAQRVNAVLGDYDAKGNQRDKGDPKHPDNGDVRLRQIENVVRQLATKVDAIAKKVGA